MSAMKDAFMDLQEKIYCKLENLGLTRERIYAFEELLIDNIDWSDFAEKMAGYISSHID